jgi:hypothetical protein
VPILAPGESAVPAAGGALPTLGPSGGLRQGISLVLNGTWSVGGAEPYPAIEPIELISNWPLAGLALGYEKLPLAPSNNLALCNATGFASLYGPSDDGAGEGRPAPARRANLLGAAQVGPLP